MLLHRRILFVALLLACIARNLGDVEARPYKHAISGLGQESLRDEERRSLSTDQASGAISNFSASLFCAAAGGSGYLRLTFAAETSIPGYGSVHLILDSSFSFWGSNYSEAYFVWPGTAGWDGSETVAVSASTWPEIEFTIESETGAEAGTSFTLDFYGVQNPGEEGDYSFQLYTTDAGGTALDAATADYNSGNMAAVTITAAPTLTSISISDETLETDGSTIFSIVGTGLIEYEIFTLYGQSDDVGPVSTAECTSGGSTGSSSTDMMWTCTGLEGLGTGWDAYWVDLGAGLTPMLVLDTPWDFAAPNITAVAAVDANGTAAPASLADAAYVVLNGSYFGAAAAAATWSGNGSVYRAWCTASGTSSASSSGAAILEAENCVLAVAGKVVVCSAPQGGLWQGQEWRIVAAGQESSFWSGEIASGYYWMAADGGATTTTISSDDDDTTATTYTSDDDDSTGGRSAGLISDFSVTLENSAAGGTGRLYFTFTAESAFPSYGSLRLLLPSDFTYPLQYYYSSYFAWVGEDQLSGYEYTDASEFPIVTLQRYSSVPAAAGTTYSLSFYEVSNPRAAGDYIIQLYTTDIFGDVVDAATDDVNSIERATVTITAGGNITSFSIGGSGGDGTLATSGTTEITINGTGLMASTTTGNLTLAVTDGDLTFSTTDCTAPPLAETGTSWVCSGLAGIGGGFDMMVSGAASATLSGAGVNFTAPNITRVMAYSSSVEQGVSDSGASMSYVIFGGTNYGSWAAFTSYNSAHGASPYQAWYYAGNATTSSGEFVELESCYPMMNHVSMFCLMPAAGWQAQAWRVAVAGRASGVYAGALQLWDPSSGGGGFNSSFAPWGETVAYYDIKLRNGVDSGCPVRISRMCMEMMPYISWNCTDYSSVPAYVYPDTTLALVQWWLPTALQGTIELTFARDYTFFQEEPPETSPQNTTVLRVSFSFLGNKLRSSVTQYSKDGAFQFDKSSRYSLERGDAIDWRNASSMSDEEEALNGTESIADGVVLPTTAYIMNLDLTLMPTNFSTCIAMS